jgi:hypothetical protein
MKGTIIVCLQELVVERGGIETWQRTLSEANIDTASMFMLNQDVDEAESAALFKASANVLELPWEQLCDAFGHHWCVVYAPKIYRSFYSKHKDLRTFILDINDMHARMTAALPRARPPRFRTEAIGTKSLLVHYESTRGLIDLAIGLSRGMAVYFQESVSIEKLSASQFRIDF